MALYEHQQRRAARAQERAACVGAAGGTARARSKRRGWARATGKNEKRTSQGGGACGEMAVAANAE
jgi:hypothetical protein